MGNNFDSYSEFLNDVQNGTVQYAKISQDKLHITYKRQGEADEEHMDLPVGNRVLDSLVEAQLPVYIEPKHWINSPLDGFTLFLEFILIASIIRIVFASTTRNPMPSSLGRGIRDQLRVKPWM